MLGKFKGFNVPRRDFGRNGKGSSTLKISFCHRSNVADCLECEFCLFATHRAGQREAFEEWHAAKGKVAYA